MTIFGLAFLLMSLASPIVFASAEPEACNKAPAGCPELPQSTESSALAPIPASEPSAVSRPKLIQEPPDTNAHDGDLFTHPEKTSLEADPFAMDASQRMRIAPQNP